MSNIIKCGNCKSIINEESNDEAQRINPCPFCGSESRIYDLSVSESFSLYTSIGMKAKRKNEKKPFIEQFSGSDLCRSNGKRMEKIRIIDRENDNYQETVKDPKTGEVIHECKEKLSDHNNHGSAKKNKKDRVE